ncbi:MAG: TetR/AcrR family transcriptional regulator [bacterium]
MAKQEKSPDSEAQAYHHGRLKEALKTVALEIVQESGEKRLTFRELARRTGVTHTAPYAHYKNKDALLAAVAADGFRKLADRMEQAAADLDPDPLVQLAAIAQGYLEFATEDAAYHEIVFGAEISVDRDDPELRAADDHAFNFARGLFASAQEKGAIRDLPTDKLTLVLWASILGCAEALRVGIAQKRGIQDRDELIRLLLDVMLGGLVPR